MRAYIGNLVTSRVHNYVRNVVSRFKVELGFPSVSSGSVHCFLAPMKLLVDALLEWVNNHMQLEEGRR